MRRRLATLLLSLLASGCWGDETTLFPPGLEPAAEINEATYPVGSEAEPYPERIELVRTYAENARQRPPSIHGRGYVHAPIATVWEALQTPDVNADRRVFDRYEVRRDVEPDYDVSYAIDATIEDLITVRYTTTFRHGVIEGTLEAPLLVAVAWQKTEGSTIISELRGIDLGSRRF